MLPYFGQPASAAPAFSLLPATNADLRARESEAALLMARGAKLALSTRQLHDLALLLNGGFSPLTGFQCRDDYESVVERSRLCSGTLWPLPVTLDVHEEAAAAFGAGQHASICLLDADGSALAILRINGVWQPNKEREAVALYGGAADHPAVCELQKSGAFYVGGELCGIRLPSHFDFESIRPTPAQLRARLEQQHWGAVVAFQTRNPLHRAHFEVTHWACAQVRASLSSSAPVLLLLHPAVGPTQPGDVPAATRVHCYKSILGEYQAAASTQEGVADAPDSRGALSIELALLPLAMRMGGPREALLHCIIRQNYGATHFVVGRDHAGAASASGVPFNEPLAARDLCLAHQSELGIRVVPADEM